MVNPPNREGTRYPPPGDALNRSVGLIPVNLRKYPCINQYLIQFGVAIVFKSREAFLVVLLCCDVFNRKWCCMVFMC